MGYILNEVREPNCVHHSCFSSKLILGKPILVILKIGNIEFYRIVSTKEGKRLKLINSLRTPEKVLSISTLKESENNEAVLFLTESYKLSYLKFNEDGKHILHYCFMNIDQRGQQELCDIDPIILSGHSKGESYILLHCFQGIVQLIKANNEQSGLSTSRKRSKNKKYDSILWERPQVSSSFLGNVVTQRMVILKNPNGKGDVLAIQYRNFSYNFSMRYYRIDLKNMILHLESQFDDFEQEPTDLIAPEIGGALCLSPETFFYFPSPHIELKVREGQPNSSVCFMGGLQFLKMHLSPMDNNSNIMSRYFVSHVCIDKSRILVVSNDGMTYMLYLESKYRDKDVIEISSFHLILLSKTTVPVNVHHIDGSFFFASSRYSRSILFEVLPREPYINICLLCPTTPPFLSLDSTELDLGMKILACHGGYDSGEFSNVLSKKFETASLFKLTTSHRSLVIVEQGGKKNESSILILHSEIEGNSRMRIDWNKIHWSRSAIVDLALTNLDKILACQVFNGLHIIVTDKGVFMDNSRITHENILHCQQSLDGTVIYISGRSKLTLRIGKDTWTYPLDPNLHICSCDFVEHDFKHYILLAYWEGIYQLIRYDTCFTLILDESLNNSNATITSCSLTRNRFDNDLIYCFLISSDGLFFQHKFDTAKQVINSDIQQPIGDPLYQIVRYEDKLLIAGTSSLAGLYYDPITSFYKMSFIGITFEQPDEVTFLKDDIIAISRMNEIEFIKLKEKGTIEDETMYSTLLNLKSLHIVGTDLSVVISLLTYFSDTSDDYEKQFSLKLINDKNMNIIDIFEFDQHSGLDVVDLCLVTEPLDCLQVEFAFVVLNSSSKKGELVLPFYIESNKIKKIESSGILGLSTDGNIRLRAIKPLKDFGHRFLLIGNIIFMIELQLNEDEFRVNWRLYTSTLIQTPSYAIGATIFKNTIVFGDLVNGIFNFLVRGNTEEGDVKKEVQKCYLNNEPFFLSALEKLESDEEAENLKCIFGDSLGNISILEIRENGDYAQTMAINLNDQINVVKKIPEVRNSKSLTSFGKMEKVKELKFFSSKALVGTSSGALFLISEIRDDKGFRSILETCQKEIVNSTQFLFDVSSSTTSKYENWLYQLDWKSLRKNLTGECVTRDNYEMIDLRPFKQWLFLDFYLSSYIKDHSGHSKLKNLLAHCYRHKDFLQRIVYYSDLI